MSNNISCQQLTGRLLNIQSINSECSRFLIHTIEDNKKDVLRLLKELKSSAKELRDRVLIEIDDGIKLCLQDYNRVSQFAIDNNLELDSDLFIQPNSTGDGFAVQNNRIVGIRFFSVGEMDFGSIKNLNKLTSVIIYSTTITNHFLDSNKNISSLELAHSRINSPEGFKFLKNMSSLKELIVSETTFDSNNLSDIKNIPIQALIIDGCNKITDFSSLLEMPDLREVVISEVGPLMEKNKTKHILKIIEALDNKLIRVIIK